MTMQQACRVKELSRQGKSRRWIANQLRLPLVEVNDVLGIITNQVWGTTRDRQWRDSLEYRGAAKICCNNVYRNGRSALEHANVVYCNFGDVVSIGDVYRWCGV